MSLENLTYVVLKEKYEELAKSQEWVCRQCFTVYLYSSVTALNFCCPACERMLYPKSLVRVIELEEELQKTILALCHANDTIFLLKEQLSNELRGISLLTGKSVIYENVGNVFFLPNA